MVPVHVYLNLSIQCFSKSSIRADLHGTTLTHATSLREAYDMTWDHLHAYDIFTYKIKIICKSLQQDLQSERVLTNVNKYFSCPMF